LPPRVLYWGVFCLRLQSKQSAGTPKKIQRLSRQVFLEKLSINHSTVNEKAMQNGMTSNAGKEGCLQDDGSRFPSMGGASSARKLSQAIRM